ncbi:GTP-binding protein Di-Ras3 [Panthera onca]
MNNKCFGFKKLLIQNGWFSGCVLCPPCLSHILFVPPEQEQGLWHRGAWFVWRVQECAGAEGGACGFPNVYLPVIEKTYRQVLSCRPSLGTLHFTDTAHGHRYLDLQCLAIAFILVYSVTKKQTVEELKPFGELFRKVKSNNLNKYSIYWCAANAMKAAGS